LVKIGPKAREWDLQGCRPAPAMKNDKRKEQRIALQNGKQKGKRKNSESLC